MDELIAYNVLKKYIDIFSGYYKSKDPEEQQNLRMSNIRKVTIDNIIPELNIYFPRLTNTLYYSEVLTDLIRSVDKVYEYIDDNNLNDGLKFILRNIELFIKSGLVDAHENGEAIQAQIINRAELEANGIGLVSLDNGYIITAR